MRRLLQCSVLLAPLLLAPAATAQGTVYYFSGAVYVASSQPPTAAVPAQCPAANPVSCTNLQQPDYCCPANNYCSWNNAQVACCPNGQTCTGSVGGVGGYQPTSWYQQSTTTYYNPPATTVVGGGGVIVPAGYATTVYTNTQQQAPAHGGYCSTQYAVGPGLPTTRQGDCGTVLIEEPGKAAKAARHGLAWVRLGGMVLGLQLLGGVVFMQR